MDELTYEELLQEIAYRIEELGGIGAHVEPLRAANARRYALETLHKIAAATNAAIRRVEENDELYLTR